MVNLKIAIVGAGSFVFGKSILKQALQDHRLDDAELALMDVSGDMVQLMAGAGRRVAAELGLKTRITVHTNLAPALDGADFVLCAAARELRRRFIMDCEIVDRYYPDHWVTEFGGVAGISYSLRQMALIETLARAMKSHCPEAWLLNTCNPLPRICQVAHESGIKTVGLCSATLEGLDQLWRIFRGASLAYPYQEAADAWDITMAGLNHFGWVVGLRDRNTGADLLPDLLHKLRNGATSGNPRSESLALETGYLLVPCDAHTRDFLPPLGPPPPRAPTMHGSVQEREANMALLRDVANGSVPFEKLFTALSWERPIDVVAAIGLGRPARFHALNLPNTGQIANLPRGVFVETPALVTASGPVPRAIPLPDRVQPLCERTARVTDAIVRAFSERSQMRLREAAELDPTILDKQAGIQALEECLLLHKDILPRFE